MKPKIILITPNEGVGVCDDMRWLALGDFRFAVDEKLDLRPFNYTFTGEQSPTLITVYTKNNLKPILERLTDIDSPLVLEFRIREINDKDLMVQENYDALNNIKFVSEIMTKSNWQYVLILGLPFDMCRPYIDLAYTVDMVTNLADGVDALTWPDTVRAKCIHQKATIN